MKLNKSTLAEIPIDKPSYNRDEIGIGIVHFGVGGFHRAHQAMYVDRLLEMGLAKEWGICGVGVLPSDRKMADVMAAQDGLYTLVLENPDGSREPRVIGSIVDYRYAPDDPEAVIELLAAPRHPDHLADHHRKRLSNIDNLGSGVTVFGLVADALAPAAEALPRRRSCRATTSKETATSRRRRSLHTPNAHTRASASR